MLNFTKFSLVEGRHCLYQPSHVSIQSAAVSARRQSISINVAELVPSKQNEERDSTDTTETKQNKVREAT